MLLMSQYANFKVLDFQIIMTTELIWTLCISPSFASRVVNGSEAAQWPRFRDVLHRRMTGQIPPWPYVGRRFLEDTFLCT